MSKSLSYYGNINHTLLAMLPSRLGKVVEFGCANGGLAAAYRDTKNNDGGEWYGLELFEDAAAQASEHMVRCYTGDGEDAKLVADTIAKDAPFDALIYADTLEHFRYPRESLHLHLQLLAPTANVFVSIPNVQHWTMLRELIEGRFDYKESGLFDYTHLHFFTLQSIYKLFANEGFEFREGRPLVPKSDAPLLGGGEKRETVAKAVAAYLGRPITKNEWTRFDAYQYVLRFGRSGGDEIRVS